MAIHTLVRYDAMCTAIAECHHVDEVKSIRDKAMALEMYSRQARNTEAERRASEVRLRAERRAGELLKDLARAEGPQQGKAGPGRGNTSDDATCLPAQSPYAEALESTGITRQTAHRYQALANVPEKDFEHALRDPKSKPTTTGLIREARDPQPKLDPDALWLWGRVNDFDRSPLSVKTALQLFEKLTPAMQDDLRRILPQMADFYVDLSEALP